MTLTPLNATAISDSLSASAAAMFTVEVYDSVGSTNDVVREFLSADDSHGVAALAEAQTQGRGRRGRSWHSPAGANLYLSLGWRFHGPVERLSGLSLAVGAMLAEAIARDCEVDLALKWPNDLYFGERKLGGVLIELLGEQNGAIPVIAGIGLNVNMPLEDAEAIQRPWTDLATALGTQVDRNRFGCPIDQPAGLRAHRTLQAAKWATGLRTGGSGISCMAGRCWWKARPQWPERRRALISMARSW